MKLDLLLTKRSTRSSLVNNTYKVREEDEIEEEQAEEEISSTTTNQIF